MRNLPVGMSWQVSFVVEEKHLASAMGSGEVRVFATPMLIAGMEAAAVGLTRPYLDSDKTTVGVHVDVRHNAATPLGMKVTFEATLLEVTGKKLTFRVGAFDEAGPIGEGVHERVIVGQADFEHRTAAKRQVAEKPEPGAMRH